MAGLANTARLAALQGGHHHHSRRHVYHAVLCDKEGALGMSVKKVTMPLSHQEGGSSSLDAVAGSSSSIKQQLTITQPDDWHLHLRDNDGLAAVAPHSAAVFKRAIIMPNLKPPVTTVAAAVSYRERILKVLPSDSDFEPLMTLYLTDATTKDEIKLARKSGLVKAVKLYPAGATTNSQAGVTDLFGKCMPVLEEMVKQGVPLLVHGEVADSSVDIFDRERVFIETVLEPLVRKLPQLRIVMEHITTKDAVDFISSVPEGTVAATVTPQHLLLNRNAIFQGGLQPHNYCLPVLKRELHRACHPYS
jgi:dihydroorotase